MLLSKLSQWAASVFLPWLWGATRAVWKAALLLVAYFDGTLTVEAAVALKSVYGLPDLEGLTNEGKQIEAEQALAEVHSLPQAVARRVIQLAHNFLRAKQYFSAAGVK